MEFFSRELQILRQSQSKMVVEYLNSLQVKVTVEIQLELTMRLGELKNELNQTHLHQ